MNSSLSVNDLSSFFAARQHVLAALLFGSFATGRANMQSDLDIAVIPDNPLSANQTMALVRDLAIQFGRPVDVIDLAVQHGPVASEALTRGRLVYCADPVAYAERLRRMVYDQEDFVSVLRKADQMVIQRWLRTS